MAGSSPMTLEQVRNVLQNAIDSKNEGVAKHYIAILERLGVTVNYVEESEEEVLENKKLAAKDILTKSGVPPIHAQEIIKSNDFKPNETVQAYSDRILAILRRKNPNAGY